MSRSCHLPLHRRNPKWQNWTSCTRSWSRKKQNLHPNHCWSRYPLSAQLGCGQREKHSQLTSLLGTCSASQTVLQWRLSRIWQFVLWGSLRNANGQKRDLFCRSSQCRLATLFEAPSSQISLFFSPLGCLTQKSASIRLLLQPTSIDETVLPTIQLTPYRLPFSSMMDTPHQRLWKRIFEAAV